MTNSNCQGSCLALSLTFDKAVVWLLYLRVAEPLNTTQENWEGDTDATKHLGSFFFFHSGVGEFNSIS